jgi:GNAT superfamily N-acetyltransferase
MDELRFSLENDPREEDVQRVVDGLVEYNLSHYPHRDYQPLAVFLRDAAGEVVGGACGGTYWGWLFVKYLWVAEEHRGRGYGRRLLEAAEAEAARRGCHRCHLDTLEFQALPFYRKLGYEVFGTLEDCPPGYERYYLQKHSLSPSREVVTPPTGAIPAL